MSANPMFQLTDRSLRVPAETKYLRTLRDMVCNARNVGAMNVVERAFAELESENVNLQLKLLDVESETLFEFTELQEELQDLQYTSEHLRQDLARSEEKLSTERELNSNLERQNFQLSDEVSNLKLALLTSRHQQERLEQELSMPRQKCREQAAWKTLQESQ